MVELLASRPHYLAHLEPVWEALPDDVRGIRDGAALVASHTDVLAAVRAGHARIALLEHGIGQSYSNGAPAYPGGRHRDAVGLFLSPNETAAAADRAAYPGARVEIVGDPVLDRLPSQEESRPVVAISFHWGTMITPERRSTVPHYRSILPELARSFDLIGHAHPRAARLVGRIYRKAGIEFVADFVDVCRRAELYVADNTSTLFEFASTGRPVVVMNGPTFRRHVNHGLRFWDAADVGIQVDHPGELVDAVHTALVDPPGQRYARQAALDIAYAYRSGGGDRAAAAVVDWLAESRRIAA
jgi:hypothetical protein